MLSEKLSASTGAASVRAPRTPLLRVVVVDDVDGDISSGVVDSDFDA